MNDPTYVPRILVVEDENIVALDISNGLKRLGYQVVRINNSGEDAISSAIELKPDLILMDIQLKGQIDGIQAADVIRKKNNIPVIFLTAYADEATISRAKSAGPYGYLLKPFEETELHTAIQIVLEKHKKIEESEAQYVKELILSEERFRLFINSVYDYAIFLLDISGNIISWNAGAERINGYTSEEIIGKHFSILFTDEDIANNLPVLLLQKVFKEGQVLEEGWRVKKDGTQFWGHVTVSALYDKQKKFIGYGAVVHDMTKSKLTEDMLNNTVKARDEFISIASHELKTPLTSLLLQTQSFQRGQKRNDETIYERDHVNKIIEQTHKQVVRLSLLVEDMLDISRLRTGKFNLKLLKFDIRDLVDDVIEKLSGQFTQANMSLPEVAIEGSIFVEWDKDRMEQVLTNLLSNTIRYASGAPVKILAKEEGNRVKIAVQDKGTGIAKKDQERIFERFERAVDSKKITGMGLGLFISREIVEAHHGQIWVESEPGTGATFIILVPKKVASRKVKAEASLNLSQK